MIRVKIESQEHKYDSINDINERWITQQVNRRQSDDQDVCVKVHIEQDSIKIVLNTPTCSSSGGGGRRPRPQEQAIFNLWKDRGLNQTNFSGGNVVAFFKQLRKLVD